MSVTPAEDKIDLWFPTAIYVSTNVCLSELETYKSLSYEICSNEETTNPWLTSQLKTSFNDRKNGLLQLDPRFDTLSNTILVKAKNFGLNLGYNQETVDYFEFTNLWVNIIETHDYHAFHTHNTTGNAIISGVFYVDAPENAEIKFKNPYDHLHIGTIPETLNQLNFVIGSYSCKPGSLYLWKSNVSHGYDAHNNTKDKISIAFNIQVKEKQ